MESKWYKIFEAEQKRLKDEERRKANAVPTLISILVVVFGVVSLASGADAVTLLLGLVLPFILIFWFISLVTKLGKSSDPMADLKLNLARLLDTEEEFKEFDEEMLAEPQHTIIASDTLKICFTEHFIYTVDKYMGLQNIAIARYEELCTDKYSKEKSWISTSPYKFHYFIEFFDEDKERILTISMEDDWLETLSGLITERCPNLQKSEWI